CTEAGEGRVVLVRRLRGVRRAIGRLRVVTALPPVEGQTSNEDDQHDLEDQAENRGEATHAGEEAAAEQHAEQAGAEEAGGQTAEQSATEQAGARGLTGSAGGRRVRRLGGRTLDRLRG